MTDQNTADKIEALILSTEDVKDRALLLILLEMSKSLTKNTELTQDLHTEFRDHAKEEMALIIKGRFLWRVLLSLALILQSILGYLYMRHMEEFKALDRRVDTTESFVVRHEEHHKQEERYRGDPPRK